ncbi:MAG: hypothetical protein Kow00108_26570 [Calditrichia bacterium]
MIIHILNYSNFQSFIKEMFDQYYPHQNRYYQFFPLMPMKGYKPLDGFQQIDFRDTTSIKLFLSGIRDGDHILVHLLSPEVAWLVNQIRKKKRVTVYWIFYGTDLYKFLEIKYKYKLYDNPRSVPLIMNRLKLRLKDFLIYFRSGIDLQKEYISFIKQLDYFCFWNPYDYDVLKKYFRTGAKFKEFKYFFTRVNLTDIHRVDKEPFSIIVNHSASPSVNHLTILDRLKSIIHDNQNWKIYLPLSYGSPLIRKNVLEYIGKFFKNNAVPILEYMSFNEYSAFLQKMSVAIIGSYRQEGAGNIFYLLASGAKVFLRSENSFFTYLKDRGFIVFDFDQDLNSSEDLSPLTEEEQKINKQLVDQEFDPVKKEIYYRSFIE